jgi:hypothetical protein
MLSEMNSWLTCASGTGLTRRHQASCLIQFGDAMLLMLVSGCPVSLEQVEVVDMDLLTLDAWLVMGNFNNDTLEVPSINSTNSTSFNVTLFSVGEANQG